MSGHVLQLSLISAVTAGMPLLYVGLGELLAEKVGVVNIGLEGVMLVGAVLGFIVAHNSGALVPGLLAGGLGGGLFAVAFFALPVLFLRASQVLAGFALWFIGEGLSAQLGGSYTGVSLPFKVGTLDIPLLDKIPFIGPILFQQTWLVYFGVLLAVGVAFMLKRTRHGLNLRSVGEDPQAAHSSGLNVSRWRLGYVGVGGILMGLGGAILSVVVVQAWRPDLTAGRGFVALALVTFVGWRPLTLVAASFFFGVLLILGDVGQSQGWHVSPYFLDMAPYVFTVVVLLLRTWRELRSRGATLAPAALGESFAAGQR